MKLKFIACILVIALLGGCLSACQSSQSTDSGKETASTKAESTNTAETSKAEENKQGTDDGEAVELQIYLATSLTYDDVDAVSKAISDYVQPLIGCTVKLNFINTGSYAEQVKLMALSGDDFDIAWFLEGNLRSLVEQDAIMPLNDLIAQYGDGIEAAVGESFIQAAYIDGEIYGIPSLKDMAMSRMLVYDKAVAEDCGVVEMLDQVETIFDLTDIYAIVAEKYPDLDMFGGAPNAQTFAGWDWDTLSDSLGVLMDYGREAKVVNVFETDYYRELCELMHTWYSNGWIDPDIATGTDFWNARLKAGTAFSGITSFKPGNVETCSNVVGKELGYCILTDPLSCTSNVMNATLSIPASSQHPEKAMQFLQLWYTDPVVATLIIDGIEGTHYVTTDEGLITYATSADECKYMQYGMGWTMGNQFITPVWDGSNPDTWDQTKAWNESATKSVAFGFAWNSAGLENEVAACTNVLTKYRGDLETGTIDPSNIDAFVEELNANGLDRIIAAKQEQLDAYLGQ